MGVDITPNSVPEKLSPYEPDENPLPETKQPSQISDTEAMQRMMRQFGMVFDENAKPRVVMEFPKKAEELLLSGGLDGPQYLAGHPLVVDVPLGQGHVVMFALRPFWRWQTQGTYFLGFNTILNWNHLDAGKPEPKKGEKSTTDTGN